MDKRTVSYRAIALALGIALVGAGFGLWSARETAVIKRGLAEGFAINGMFQERQPGRSTLAFLDESSAIASSSSTTKMQGIAHLAFRRVS